MIGGQQSGGLLPFLWKLHLPSGPELWRAKWRTGSTVQLLAHTASSSWPTICRCDLPICCVGQPSSLAACSFLQANRESGLRATGPLRAPVLACRPPITVASAARSAPPCAPSGWLASFRRASSELQASFKHYRRPAAANSNSSA